MRVLIVHDYGTPVGGAEHLSLALRDGLRRRGHEARLFASAAEPLPGLPARADYTAYGSMRWRRVLQVANPAAAAALRRVVRTFRPDVVHVRMFMTQLSPLVLPALRGVPALLHVVNYNLICPLNTKTLPDGSPCAVRQGAVCHRTGCLPWVGVARAAAQTALTDLGVFERVVANSHWVRRRLERDGVRVDGVVWNGVPDRPARPPLAAPPVVAFAGRLVAKKGVDTLVEAFARVAAEVPDARLLVAGGGPEEGALRALVDRRGLAGRVRFLGHLSRDGLEAAFAGAWVQAVPSTWEEPFGIVAAEAMVRGTAVVASSVGGLTEQVADGETGLLAPPGDVGAWAEALLRVLADRDLAERMGRAGRRRGRADFTEDRMVDQFAALYPDVVAAAGRPARRPSPAAP